MIERVEEPGLEFYSSAKKFGELLTNQFKEDPHFYFFSPDETTSNRFDEIFEVEKRAWSLTQEPWDLPESNNGRIVEMLSENVLFSVMTGHLMNGEQAMFGSYEAFLPIITGQLLQQMKFIKQSKAVPWRKSLPAVNLLSTSTCWRQDHNGFTHQSPALISTLLSIPSDLANCIFPVDDVAAEEAFNFMLRSKDVVNLTTFDKNPRPRYIDSHHARFQFDNGGASIYQFISDSEPDFVFAAAGDIVFDPFLGSGTASVVAKKLVRRYCGIELNEEYAMLAEKRLQMADDDKTIQGYGDGVFWERNSTELVQKRNREQNQKQESQHKQKKTKKQKDDGTQSLFDNE